MALKEHDFIELDYTGALKETKDVFDTTDAAVAKEHHLRNDAKFGAVTICLGKGYLLKGLETKLIGKETGKHHIELSPDDAFGRKNAKLIVLVPTQNFLKQGVQPQPGLPVNIDGTNGIIRTVTGGRTIVDFNHPLAGKEVIYDVAVHKVVTDTQTKVASIVKVLLGVPAAVTVTKDDAAIALKDELPKDAADALSKEIIATCGVKRVTFLKS